MTARARQDMRQSAVIHLTMKNGNNKKTPTWSDNAIELYFKKMKEESIIHPPFMALHTLEKLQMRTTPMMSTIMQPIQKYDKTSRPSHLKQVEKARSFPRPQLISYFYAVVAYLAVRE